MVPGYELDARDDLACFKREFYLPEQGVYLNGNSLGLCSRRAEQSLAKLTSSWQALAIDGWSSGEHPWFYLAEHLGEQFSSIMGSKINEVVIAGSATSNLHQLISTFYKIRESGRTRILTEELSFPTDIYVLQSQLRLSGLDPSEHLVYIQSRDGLFIDEEKIIERFSVGDIALALLPVVLYRSGQLLNIKRLTQAAHYYGVIIGFDACHSAGAIPHSLHEDEVDFAVWCTYKYLNGGPGSAAALFVHERYHGLMPGLGGWFGSDKSIQFEMSHRFKPSCCAGAYQMGTPHILSMAPLLGSLELFAEAGIGQIRAKSLSLTSYFLQLCQKEMGHLFEIGPVLPDSSRGGHIYLRHPEALAICYAIQEVGGVIADFRPPDMIRLAPVAFYTSYSDLEEVVDILKFVMHNQYYYKFRDVRRAIT